MRNAFGAMGLLCGAIVVVLVARYGFKTTDVEVDAWIMAFMFGVIATFGLAGHAFAVYLWRHNRAVSIIAGLVAAISLGINLSNSLGAIAGRSDTATTERVETNRKIRAAEVELKRLTDLRNAMPAFVTTDADAAQAAQRAADTAARSREAECGTRAAQRGRNCRDREADERAANARLAEVATAKAATDRAVKLEADAAAQRKLLSDLGSIVTVDAQGSVIAKLFRLPEDEAGFAATVQQFGIAAIVELIILVCLIGWEASRPKNMPSREARPENVSEKPGNLRISDPICPPPTHIEPDVSTDSAAAPMTLPAPAAPKLVATRKGTPAGSIPRIMTAALEPAKGQRVTIEDCFNRYFAACRSEGRPAVEPGVFIEAMAKFCKTSSIKTSVAEGVVYLLDVQLVQNKTVMTVDMDA